VRYPLESGTLFLHRRRRVAALGRCASVFGRARRFEFDAPSRPSPPRAAGRATRGQPARYASAARSDRALGRPLCTHAGALLRPLPGAACRRERSPRLRPPGRGRSHSRGASHRHPFGAPGQLPRPRSRLGPDSRALAHHLPAPCTPPPLDARGARHLPRAHPSGARRGPRRATGVGASRLGAAPGSPPQG